MPIVVALSELMDLVDKKYPDIQTKSETWVTLKLYTDKSGQLSSEKEGRIFELNNVEELVAHLEDRDPNPTY